VSSKVVRFLPRTRESVTHSTAYPSDDELFDGASRNLRARPEVAARWVLACGLVRWDHVQGRWQAFYGGAWVDGEPFVARRINHLLGREYRLGDHERITEALLRITGAA